MPQTQTRIVGQDRLTRAPHCWVSDVSHFNFERTVARSDIEGSVARAAPLDISLELLRGTVTSDGSRLPVSTGGVDRPRSCDGERDVYLRLSDEALYVAVATAWCRMFLRAERREHPLGPYVLGDSFIGSVVRAPIDALRVAAVCARVVCRHAYGDRESWPVELWSRGANGPVMGWWCAIEQPDGLGLHHVELDGGLLEFVSVAHFDDRPNLESFQ